MIGDLEKLSVLNLVRVEKNIEDGMLQEIAKRIKKSFSGIINTININTLEIPSIEGINVDSMDAFFLTVILNHSYCNKHTLGITNAELTTEDEDEPYKVLLGGKNPRNDVAVVSTRRLETPEYDTLINRIAKVSIHEVGHNLGLIDHGKFQSTEEGYLCPMSKGEFNKFGLHGYVRAVIDQRGFRFCNDCEHFLTKVYGYQNQSTLS